MKIEKVNDNQIRCTLTKKDLADRQIRLSELAYGSEKARTLFRDMIQQAHLEFGFEANDIPLMVEAIPMSPDSITLVITKVEYPEELDTRFSKFSEPDDDLSEDDFEDFEAPGMMQGADDIVGLFSKLIKEQEKAHNEAKGQSKDSPAAIKDRLFAEIPTDLVKLYEFRDMDQLVRLAKILYGYYNGINDLYKDEAKKRYVLMMHKGSHTPQEFNKVCNIISEYATQMPYTRVIGAHFEEHGNRIIKDKALQTLASLS